MVASQKTGVDSSEFQRVFSATRRLIHEDVIVGVKTERIMDHSGSDFWEATLRKTLYLCQGPLFPRTISTHKTQGRQIEVSNIEEILKQFEAAEFLDCRINVFPRVTKFNDVNMQPPTFVMCDIDLMKFRTERQLLQSLDETVENIKKDIGGVPMVLFTGNGYHVYQPIKLPVLEQESIFSTFVDPSTEFIRYAAQKWTNGKNDPSNHPSVNSCLLRVPGSINSKNNRAVEIVQEWNGNAPAANQMLSNFYLKLAAKKLAHKSKESEYYFYPTTYMKKNYRHFTHTSTEAAGSIHWIDDLLAGDGIIDYRKLMVDLVIAPYFVNIKQYDYDTAYSKIGEWLDKCGRKKRLDFSPRFKITYALKRSLKTGIKPMRLETMKNDYNDMYNEIGVNEK
jgi:hypothetical protein